MNVCLSVSQFICNEYSLVFVTFFMHFLELILSV
jgi:hypothetical protein